MTQRPMVTLYVPSGYKDWREFLSDCQFERVEWTSQMSYDMRWPSGKGYEDSLQVTVRRCSFWERLRASWLLMTWPYRRP